MRTEFKPDELCGCGSRKTYAQCCKKKRVCYERDGRGTVFKSILLDKSGHEVFEQAGARFKILFGRKPSRRDRIFVDGYAYSPTDLKRDMMKAFTEAGIPKQLAYAYAQTELIITPENSELASPSDLEDYQTAIEEYIAAADIGIDLLSPDDGPVATKLDEFREILEMIVIHLGSYADRSPRSTENNAAIFFQYLLVGKAHQCAKALHSGWGSHLKTETFSLLRSIYECALLIRRLHEQREFASTLFAQALVGRGPFVYRTKKNGETDFSKIINVESGEMFDARTSYFDCAKIASEDESIFFEIVYPYLSSNIHFDARDFIIEYKKSGSFLIWETGDSATQAIFILAVFAYFVISLSGSGGVPINQQRDMQYLLSKIAGCFYGLYVALDDEDKDVDEHTSLVVFTVDRLFRGESLGSAEDIREPN